MKKIVVKTSLVLFSIFSFLLYSCSPDKEIDKEIDKDQNSVNFDFKTTKQIKVSVSTLDSQNKPIAGALIQIYTQNPLTAEGLLKDNSSDFLAFKGISSKEGKLDSEIATATFVDSLSILVQYIGLPSLTQVKINSENITVVIGGSANKNANKSAGASKTTATTVFPDPTKVSGFYVLGSWDLLGKPNYLMNVNDIVTADFLADMNNSLPEQIAVPTVSPQYLSSSDGGDIVLIKDAEVWITFVHEGAGNKNAVGYYTHENDNPPASKTEITDKTIVFPNFSFNNSGGDLYSGNKVQLLYLDPSTGKYTKYFPAGTTVAWFVLQSAFNTDSTIRSNATTFYSDKRFNPETTPQTRKHNVVLLDNARQRLVIGFEDTNRQSPNSDQDFNDAVFYSTITPFTAVVTDKYQPLKPATDTDGDGVNDVIDDYPTNPLKAFNNYYPSKDNVATLAYEDMWPRKGDYDFNDLVVDYNFNRVSNGSNNVVEVNAAITIRAIGASFKNAFSLQFNTAPANVKSVTGQSLNNSVFALNSNGTEINQALAVVPIFDDPLKVLGISGGLVNTSMGGSYIAPKTMNVKIEFITPMSLSSLGTVPYNPFIVVNGVRGKEVHLAASAPTDLVDKSLFGSSDDDTNLATQKYYMSDTSLPWAINTPVQFAYPAEREDIRNGFNFFNNWSESRGSNHDDWYIDISGYRDISKLYKR
jgi:LruC domain-containing protein